MMDVVECHRGWWGVLVLQESTNLADAGDLKASAIAYFDEQFGSWRVVDHVVVAAAEVESGSRVNHPDGRVLPCL